MKIHNAKTLTLKMGHASIIMAGVVISIFLGLYSNLFSLLALIVSTLLVFVFSEEQYLCLLFFLMPLANIFKSSPESQSFFTYLVLFYVLYNAFFKRRINNNFLIAILLLASYLALQMCISIDVIRTIKIITNMLLIYYALLIDIKKDGKNVFLSYILGIITSSAIVASGLFSRWKDYVGEKGLGGETGIIRFSGLYGDPNYYSINLIISLCLIIVLMHKKSIKPLWSIILSVSLVAFAIMTFSKSAFLMLCFPAFFLLYSKAKSKQYLVSFCLIALGTIFVVNMLQGRIELLSTIVNRFAESEDINSLTTGRFEIWKSYLYYFEESGVAVFWGNGFGAELLNSKGAHNTYIDLIYYLGIFGTVLVVATVFCIIPLKEGNRKNFLNYSIFLCVLVMYFFLSELFYFDWPFHIIIAGMVLRSDLRKSSIEE